MMLFLSYLCLLATVTQAGQIELSQLLEVMEGNILQYAKVMEAVYIERCSEMTRRECANKHYDECNSLFPFQSCPDEGVVKRPECAVTGMSCEGLYDFTVSTVRLSQDVSKGVDGNPIEEEVKEALCYSIQADEYLIETLERYKSDFGRFAFPSQIFFGTENGAFRIYPARQSKTCGTYDPTRRPWYVAATSGPKDVILVLDTSGSMLQRGRLDLMKQAANRVVDTLTVGDHVSVISFSDNAYTDRQFMVQATKVNRDLIKTSINNLSAEGATNFLAAFDKAYDVIDNSMRLEYSSFCHLAILFLTDGKMTAPENVTAKAVIDHIQQREQGLNINSHIFMYGLGADAKYLSAAGDLKEIACATDGMWSFIEDGGDLATAMANYYKLFSLGLGQNENENFLSWVEPYYYATGNILGTTVSAPVYDRSVIPNVLVGAVGIDFTMTAMDSALGGEADSHKILGKLTQKSAAICPRLNLTECVIQSLRHEAGGNEALCPNECTNFVGIQPNVCRNVSDLPAYFWDNMLNKNQPFEKRTCCAIGEIRQNGTVFPLSKTDPSQQCIVAALEGHTPKPQVKTDRRTAGIICGTVGAFLLLDILFLLFHQKCEPRFATSNSRTNRFSKDEVQVQPPSPSQLSFHERDLSTISFTLSSERPSSLIPTMGGRVNSSETASNSGTNHLSKNEVQLEVNQDSLSKDEVQLEVNQDPLSKDEVQVQPLSSSQPSLHGRDPSTISI